HKTEQVWKSFGQLHVARQGWRIAPVSAKELDSFSRLRAAQEGWRVAPGS
ncbi:hypothetical protein A2U01_0101094, partial [Trifolium medium]|nr:hypothetical protein [Trifolium medium]